MEITDEMKQDIRAHYNGYARADQMAASTTALFQVLINKYNLAVSTELKTEELEQAVFPNVMPRSPEEARKNKVKYIPEMVFTIVNEFIDARSGEGSFNIKLKEIMDAYEVRQTANPPLSRKAIYDMGYMDFESVYRDRGWDVVFDRPGWDENYDSFYKFAPKGGRRDGGMRIGFGS